MSTSHGDAKGLEQLTQEIERYLQTHPHAADSVDGVLKWWLPRQRYEDSAIRVQQAMEWLVQRGVVSKNIVNGEVVYSMNSSSE